MALLGTSVRKTIELVLPAHCVGCGMRGAYLCAACIDGMTPASPTTVDGAGYAFDSATSPFAYDGVARKAVHHLKFRHLRAIAPVMGEAMAAIVPASLALDAVVPVPLHRSRLRERGYNQSALLASHVARALGVPFLPDVLSRTTQRGTQVEARGAAARQANVRSAFVASAGVAGLRVTLVDDVTTTGATLAAAAGALKRAGAVEVHGLTFAREG